MDQTTPARVPWLATTPADYDRRRMVRGHKRDGTDQGALFFQATPTAERAAPAREELPGQVSLFGDEQ